MRRINRLSRILFNEIIGVPTERRAIAFAILMKNLKPSSVVKDWSYRLLSRESGLAQDTCRKYIRLLKEMKLVSIHSYQGHKYLIFKKLKEHKKKNRRNGGYHTPKNQDVMLRKYDPTSFKSIEKELKALYIRETQSHKDYCRQSICAYRNPKSTREYKKAQKICRARGWDKFDKYNDYGISYKYLCKGLHASPNTVSATIKYGEIAGMFSVARSTPIPIFYGPGEAKQAAEYLDEPYSWSDRDFVYYQPANRYTVTVSG